MIKYDSDPVGYVKYDDDPPNYMGRAELLREVEKLRPVYDAAMALLEQHLKDGCTIDEVTPAWEQKPGPWEVKYTDLLVACRRAKEGR